MVRWNELKIILYRLSGKSPQAPTVVIEGDLARWLIFEAQARQISIHALVESMAASDAMIQARNDILLESWRQLSPKMRETAILVRQGYAIKEIAAILTLKVSTTRVRIRRLADIFGVYDWNELQQLLYSLPLPDADS